MDMRPKTMICSTGHRAFNHIRSDAASLLFQSSQGLCKELRTTSRELGLANDRAMYTYRKRYESFLNKRRGNEVYEGSVLKSQNNV